jgi:hypothetical protein
MKSSLALTLSNGAATRYEDFCFDSFFEADGIPYGVNAAGIWRLDDPGGHVDARVDLGRLDFGTSKRKHLPAIWLEAASPKPLAVVVSCPQGRFDYKTREAYPEMRTRRVDCGKGLRANFYDIAIGNICGAPFALINVEAGADAQQRRI